MYRTRWKRLAAAGCLVLIGGLGIARAADEKKAKPKPERFAGIVMVVNAPKGGIVRLKVSIDRWSTNDERKTYIDAIKSGGSDALASAMENVRLGYVQFDQNVRTPLAYAVKFKTDKGEKLRFATNRPIAVQEQFAMTRSKDYPIGYIELLIPPDGPGDGTILAATKVQFNDKGQLEVESLPQNTGPQRVTQVERE